MPSRIRSSAASSSLWRTGPGRSEMISAELFGKAGQSAGLHLDGGSLGATDGSKISLKMRKNPPKPSKTMPQSRPAALRFSYEMRSHSRKEPALQISRERLQQSPRSSWENWTLHTGPTGRKKRENGNVECLLCWVQGSPSGASTRRCSGPFPTSQNLLLEHFPWK